MHKRLYRRYLVAVKGAGDLATGVIHRLARAGFPVMATELAHPTVVRRTVAFAEAVALGSITVEAVTAPTGHITRRLFRPCCAKGEVPIVVDPHRYTAQTTSPYSAGRGYALKVQ